MIHGYHAVLIYGQPVVQLKQSLKLLPTLFVSLLFSFSLIFSAEVRSDDEEVIDAVALAYERLWVEENPDDSVRRLRLASWLRRIGQYDEASTVLDVIYQQLPGRPEWDQAASILQERLTLSAVSQVSTVMLKSQINQAFMLANAQGWTLEQFDQVIGASSQQLPLSDLVEFHQRRLSFIQNNNDKINALIELAAEYREVGRVDKEIEQLEKAYFLFSETSVQRKFVRDRWVSAALELDPEKALDVVRTLMPNYGADAGFINRAVDIALQNSALSDAVTWLEKAHELDPNNTEYLEKLVEFSLANENVSAASDFSERLSRVRPDNIKYREQSAKLAGWDKKPKRALKHARYLANRTGSEQKLLELKNLALEIGDYTLVINTLNKINRKRTLSISEHLERIESHLLLNDTKGASHATRLALTVFPESKKLLEKHLAFSLESSDTQTFTRSVKQYRNYYPTTMAQDMAIAQKYFEIGDKAAAFLSVDDPAVKHLQALGSDSESINLGARYCLQWQELALTVEREISVGICQPYLNNEELISDALLARRLMSLHATKKEWQQAFGIADTAWQQHGETEFLASSAIYATELGNYSEAQARMVELESLKPDLYSAVDAITLRARLSTLTGQSADSIKMWQAARALAPDNKTIQDSYNNALLDAFPVSRDDLNIELQTIDVDEYPRFSARGWTLLDQPELALQALKLIDLDSDENWQFALIAAQNQRQLNVLDAVEHYEKKALAVLSKKVVKDSAGRYETIAEISSGQRDVLLENYLHLAYQYEKEDRAAYRETVDYRVQLETNSIKMIEARQKLFNLGMTWNLRERNHVRIEKYLAIADSHNIEINPQQHLACALELGNDELTEQILTVHSERLSMLDQTLAYQRIGRQDKVRDLSLTLLKTQKSRTHNESAFKLEAEETLKTLFATNSSAWQVEFNGRTMGDITRKTTKLNGLWVRETDAFSATLNKHSFKADEDGTLELAKDFKAQDLVTLGYKKESFSGQIFGRSAAGEWIIGGEVLLRPNLQRHRMEFRAFANDEAELGAILLASADSTGLEFLGVMQLANQFDMYLRTAWEAYSTLEDEPLGEGSRTELGARKTLRFDSLNTQWRLVHSHASYIQDMNALAHLTPYFGTLNNETEVLPDAFDRTSLGVQVLGGSLHRLQPYWVKKLHYTIDLDVGYEQHSEKTDSNASAGIGFELTGGDELALTIGSAKLGNNDDNTDFIRLTYSRLVGAKF